MSAREAKLRLAAERLSEEKGEASAATARALAEADRLRVQLAEAKRQLSQQFVSNEQSRKQLAAEGRQKSRLAEESVVRAHELERMRRELDAAREASRAAEARTETECGTRRSVEGDLEEARAAVDAAQRCTRQWCPARP